MNRREFVKALAGIPLLGLLVKVPEEEGGTPTFVDSALYGAAYEELRSGAEAQPPYELRTAQCRVSQDWFLLSDKQPYHAVASMGDVGEVADDWLVMAYQDDQGNWRRDLVIGTPPADLHWSDPSPLGITYWNGEKWIGL